MIGSWSNFEGWKLVVFRTENNRLRKALSIAFPFLLIGGRLWSVSHGMPQVLCNCVSYIVGLCQTLRVWGQYFIFHVMQHALCYGHDGVLDARDKWHNSEKGDFYIFFKSFNNPIQSIKFSSKNKQLYQINK